VDPVKKLIGNEPVQETKGEPLNLDVLLPNMWVDCLDKRSGKWYALVFNFILLKLEI
jgi:hypothetical protein